MHTVLEYRQKNAAADQLLVEIMSSNLFYKYYQLVLILFCSFFLLFFYLMPTADVKKILARKLKIGRRTSP